MELKGFNQMLIAVCMILLSFFINQEMALETDLDINSKKITNLPAPTLRSDAATKSYIDGAGLDATLNSVACNAFVDSFVNEKASCFYAVYRAFKEEVLFNPTTRKVSRLYDKTLSGLNASQTNSGRQPTLSSSKNAKRYFLGFSTLNYLESQINLNPAAGADDVVDIFVLCRLNSMSSSNYGTFENVLFTQDFGNFSEYFRPLPIEFHEFLELRGF